MHRSLARLFPVCVGVAVITGLAPVKEARGQDCASLSGPARTDCYLGRSRVLGEQSGIAASSARLRTSAERLRAVTGGSYDPLQPRANKAHRAGSRHTVHSR
jgi:hypothetical protein